MIKTSKCIYRMLGLWKGENFSPCVSLLAVRRFNFVTQNIEKENANLCREKNRSKAFPTSKLIHPEMLPFMDWPPSNSLPPKTNRFELISKGVLRRPWEKVLRAEHLNLLNKSHFTQLRYKKSTSGRLLKFIRFFLFTIGENKKIGLGHKYLHFERFPRDFKVETMDPIIRFAFIAQSHLQWWLECLSLPEPKNERLKMSLEIRRRP